MSIMIWMMNSIQEQQKRDKATRKQQDRPRIH